MSPSQAVSRTELVFLFDFNYRIFCLNLLTSTQKAISHRRIFVIIIVMAVLQKKICHSLKKQENHKRRLLIEKPGYLSVINLEKALEIVRDANTFLQAFH